MLCDKAIEVIAQYHEYHNMSIACRLWVVVTVDTTLCDGAVGVVAQYHEYHDMSVTWRLQVVITMNTTPYDKVAEFQFE
jgi:hypothetical protein